MFKSLPLAQIQEIVTRLEPIAVDAQEIVIQQGEIGDYYYIIDEGECTVFRESPGKDMEIHVADLLPGDAFGEEALITGAGRNARVRMKSDGHLLRMTQEDFDTCIHKTLVHELTLAQSLQAIEKSAVWIDVRPPDQFASGGFNDALNIPLSSLRREWQKLSPKRRYIVCDNDTVRGAVGALLLVQRGLQASCLDQSIVDCLQDLERDAWQDFGQPRPSPKEVSAGSDTVVPFPHPTSIGSHWPSNHTETDMYDGTQNPDKPRATTSEPGPDLESIEPISRDLYDDTFVGKSLADLIAQMQTRHQELHEDNSAPGHIEEETVSVIDLENFEHEVDQTLPRAYDDLPTPPWSLKSILYPSPQHPR